MSKKKGNKKKNGENRAMQMEDSKVEESKSVEQEESVQDPIPKDEEKIIRFEEEKAKKELEEDALAKAQEEIADLKSTVQRTQADFINYKRRTEEEKMRISAMANESIIIELLGVIDNFERALANPGNTEKAFVDGVELIKKQILDLMQKYDVKEIPTDIDFDPNFHYAVMQEDAEESGKILEVFQKGYTLKDKVIRPSMVKVSK